MKTKTIATTIGLACAGTAWAQQGPGEAPLGGVQLYGTVGAAVTHKSNQTGNTSNNELTNSLFIASYFGLRGNEDLGGGMRALFRLEAPFAINNGTAGQTVAGTNKFWGRQANVGLAINPNITVTAGRQFHAASDRVIRNLDVFQVGGTSLHTTPLALFGVNRFSGNDSRVDSSVKLRFTGPMGLQAGVSGGMNDGAGRSVTADVAQVTPQYAIGAWVAKFESPTVIAATGARPEQTLWGLGGNATLGPVRLYLHYLDSELDATVANRPAQTNQFWHMGANWQALPNTSVKLGYYHDKGEAVTNVAGRNGTKKTWVLQAEYALSKRSSLHAGAFSNSFSGGYKLDPVNINGLARDAASSSTRGVTVGVRHDF